MGVDCTGQNPGVFEVLVMTTVIEQEVNSIAMRLVNLYGQEIVSAARDCCQRQVCVIASCQASVDARGVH